MDNLTIEPKRKWIFRWIIFISLFVYLFVHISYLFRPTPVDRENVAGYYAEDKNSLDMVYIGGSSTFVYWAPMEAWENYGIASYDFGYNTMPADTFKSTVEEALKTQDPSLLVLDLRGFQNRPEHLFEVPIRNYTDSIKYSLNRERLIDKVVTDDLDITADKNKMNYHLDIAKYHTRWKELNENSWKLRNNINYNPNKGFYFVPKKLPLFKINNEIIKTTKPVIKKADEAFTELLEYCKDLNKQVLFVVNPYVELPEHREMYNYLRNRIYEYGFDYINTNEYIEEMNIDYNNDLYNEDHVNIYGAEKFTDFLAKYIKYNYELPDRRNNQKYDLWNEYIPTWNQQVKDTKQAIDNYVE